MRLNVPPTVAELLPRRPTLRATLARAVAVVRSREVLLRAVSSPDDSRLLSARMAAVETAVMIGRRLDWASARHKARCGAAPPTSRQGVVGVPGTCNRSQRSATIPEL
jgi:hypothetical protein